MVRLSLVACLMTALPGGAAAQDRETEIVAPASRDVTPPGVTPAPAGDGPFVREPTPPRPPDPPRWRRFFLPKTSDSATLHVDAGTIRVSGVTPPSADTVCQRTNGSEWPCGRAALYAFRMFIGGRAVECYFPAVEGAVDIVAPCRIGSTDLGLWLSQQGWARPSDLATDEYRDAFESARCAYRGLWRWTDQSNSGCPKPEKDSVVGVR